MTDGEEWDGGEEDNNSEIVSIEEIRIFEKEAKTTKQIALRLDVASHG